MRRTGANTTDRNDRIREIAYFLWLDEGCPEGEAERHWSTAEAMLIPSLPSASRSKANLPANRWVSPAPAPALRRGRKQAQQ